MKPPPPPAVSRWISCQLLGLGVDGLPSVNKSILNAELTGLAKHQQQFMLSEAGPTVALVCGLSFNEGLQVDTQTLASLAKYDALKNTSAEAVCLHQVANQKRLYKEVIRI